MGVDTRRIWRISAGATEGPADVLGSTSRSPTERNEVDKPGCARGGRFRNSAADFTDGIREIRGFLRFEPVHSSAGGPVLRMCGAKEA